MSERKEKPSEVAKRLLQQRSLAYGRVFDSQNVFVEEVLADLAEFCRAHESTFMPDARLHAVLEGRREVWLRIQKYLNLSVEQIYRLQMAKAGTKQGE